MKLGYVDPEMYLTKEEQAATEAVEKVYRPKFQHARPWSEAERARNPTHYESASYACRWKEGESNNWTVYRMAWKGVPDLPCGMAHSLDHAKRYIDWLITNDREIHRLASEGNSDLFLLLMRGMVESANG